MSQFEMSILVGNKPIEIYHHEGSDFVEGRKGSEYTVRLRNASGARACFVLSIDGLSVIDGQEAGNDSPGYVINPYETLDVACYKVDDSTGAKFIFGSKDKSYSAEVGKGTTNVGVIAALVFKEKPQPLYYPSVEVKTSGGPIRRSFDTLRGGGPMFGSNSWTCGSMSSSVRSSVQTKSSATAASAAPRGLVPSADDFEQSALGTSFGGAMNWRTQTIIFEREGEHPNANLAIFYDSKKNLERRGIEFKKKVPPLPNPFPANGCPTPPGWRK